MCRPPLTNWALQQFTSKHSLPKVNKNNTKIMSMHRKKLQAIGGGKPSSTEVRANALVNKDDLVGTVFEHFPSSMQALYEKLAGFDEEFKNNWEDHKKKNKNKTDHNHMTKLAARSIVLAVKEKVGMSDKSSAEAEFYQVALSLYSLPTKKPVEAGVTQVFWSGLFVEIVVRGAFRGTHADLTMSEMEPKLESLKKLSKFDINASTVDVFSDKMANIIMGEYGKNNNSVAGQSNNTATRVGVVGKQQVKYILNSRIEMALGKIETAYGQISPAGLAFLEALCSNVLRKADANGGGKKRGRSQAPGGRAKGGTGKKGRKAV